MSEQRATPRAQWPTAGWIMAFLGATALLATSCADGSGDALRDGGQGADRLATASFRIVGGSAESGFAAVGALVEDGQAFCTGTLVAPTTVVTAAHCVVEISSTAGLGFFVGPDATRPTSGSTTPIASVLAHPDYNREGKGANDIAIVKLAAPPSVTPIPYLHEAMGTAWVGRQLVFVGYGVTSASSDDAGVKRSVTIALSAVMDTAFEYRSPSKNTCFGDSGGPALAQVGGQYQLIGVTSYGDSDCAEYGVDTRVDPYIDFIEGSLSQGESTPASTGVDDDPQGQSDDLCDLQGWYGDGICDVGCAQPDPDCDGLDTSPAAGDEPGDGEDLCADQGWYGDGLCDVGCAQPDPDCSTETPDDEAVAPAEDECEAQGWYGDGLCDAGCAQPDPDCDGVDATPEDDGPPGADDDLCATEGWYGDGLCDLDCAQPDPDCD